jgi:fluoride ion exporter CrcB/FEX
MSLAIGIYGKSATFSSFSVQTYNLATEGRWLSALATIFFFHRICLGCVGKILGQRAWITPATSRGLTCISGEFSNPD